MLSTIASLIQFLLIALASIFFLVDPIAAIPAFLVMAKRAAWTCFIVLSGFALAGTLIFKVFGITLPAFKIAGGVILMLIGLDMLQARRSKTKETPGETEEGAAKDDVGIIPLGVPMLAGPGSISTVMVLISEVRIWWHALPIFVAIGVTALASYWILAAADAVRHYLGETGISVVTRMMGLLLTAIAVQFILNGLTDVGLVK